MPYLYLLHFVNIIHYNKFKNIAIISKKKFILYDKLKNDECTDILLYHGLLIDHINQIQKIVITDENYNYIISNQTNRDKIYLVLKDNLIYFINKNKNIIKEIATFDNSRTSQNMYNNIQIY